MTRFHQVLAQCPVCFNEDTLTLWDEINAGTDPDLRERLLRKTLQSLECRNCGHSTLIAAPLSYCDPDLGLAIECRPDLDPDQLDRHLADQQAGGLSLGTDLPSDRPKTLRLTATLNDLIEKIHIFENGLDDQVLEIVKLAVIDHQGQTAENAIEDLRLVGRSGSELQFVLKNADGWFQYELPLEAYVNASRIQEQITASAGPEPDAGGRCQIIDRRTARRALETFKAAMSG